ncbi:hypothetical protein ABPG74_003042 [Tetrahymena malaccensis]
MGQIKSKIITNIINKNFYSILQKFANSHLGYHENLQLDFIQLNQEETLILADSIKKCEKLKVLNLNLNQNKSDFQTLQLVMKGISECHNLQSLTLNLRNIYLKNKGEQLGSSIAKNLNIQNLVLSLLHNSFDNQDGHDIIIGISKCPNLSQLALNFSITDQGISQIGQGLAQCKRLKNLKLNIFFNNSGVECLEDLLIGIAQCENLSILALVIGFRNRQIMEPCRIFLASQIKIWKKLTTLKILIDGDTLLHGQKRNDIIDLQAKKLDRLVNLRVIYI